MKLEFPSNPTDNMLFEASPNIFYQYEARDKTWVRVEGVQINFDLATPLRDGLMSKEDFKKLNGLLIPPPRTTLKSEDCNLRFDHGTYSIRSTKEHLLIEHDLSLFGADGSQKKELWRIHENTFGIDFRINLPILVDILTKKGKLTYKKLIGEQGDKGQTGDHGIDKLLTGPRGPKGEDGNNAAYPGSLIKESVPLSGGDGNRAIVDIDIEEISEDENYLIVTRANVGNLDQCPTKVKPKKLNSKWVVVLDETAIDKKLIEECDLCSTNLCSRDARERIIRSFCATKLFYVDMSPFEEAINNRFTELLTNLKNTKEMLVNEWMKTMIEVFNEQKLAICCAIENCESRRENSSQRARLEQLRVDAASTGLALNVGGSGKIITHTNAAECPASELPAEPGTTGTCLQTLKISCQSNGKDNPVSIELDAGIYVASISSCCCFVASKASISSGKKNQIISDSVQQPRQLSVGLGTDTGAIAAGFEVVQKSDLQELRIDALRAGDNDGSGHQLIAEIVRNIGGLPSREIVATKTLDAKLTDIWTSINDKPGATDFTKLNIRFSNIVLDAGLYFIVLREVGTGFFYISTISGEANPNNQFYFSSGDPIVADPGWSKDSTTTLTYILNITPKSTQEVTLKTKDRTDLDVDTTKAVKESENYTGKIAFRYRGDSGEVEAEVADLGLFSTEELAHKAYIDRHFTFHHEGGKVETYFEKTAATNDGEIEVCIRSSGAVTKDLERAVTRKCSADFVTSLSIGCKDNAGEINAQSIDLLPGNYEITITDCDCFDANLISTGSDIVLIDETRYQQALVNNEVIDILIKNQMRPYTGKISFIRMDPGPVLDRTRIAADVNEGGNSFSTLQEARNNFIGKTFKFKHQGGPVKFFFDDYDFDPHFGAPLRQFGDEQTTMNNAGKVDIQIKCLTPINESGCEIPDLEFDINCSVNNNESSAVSGELAAGNYVAEISDCCCFGGNPLKPGFTGVMFMKHQSAGGEQLLSNIDLGSPNDELVARNLYLGNSFGFAHVGGVVKAWLPETAQSGKLKLSIRRKICFETDLFPGTGTNLEVQDEPATFSTCDMSTDQILFYEIGWKTGACCGFSVDLDGLKFIIVQRSIGTDTTCGGGESEASDCIKKATMHGFYPAIAFPTINGQDFIGKPTSGFQRMFRDVALETTILQELVRGAALIVVGDPTNIKSILFPLDQ